MSAFAAQVITLVSHLVAFLQTFGDRAIPIATATLKFLDKAEPFIVKLLPVVAPYVDAIQVALTLLVQHGPEIANDLDAVLKLLGSVGIAVPKLEAIAAAGASGDQAAMTTAMAMTVPSPVA